MLAFLAIATIVDLGPCGSPRRDFRFHLRRRARGPLRGFRRRRRMDGSFIGCLAAPAAGFILRRRGYPGAGAAAAFVPVLLGLTMAFGGP
jgi:hypothetical protein